MTKNRKRVPTKDSALRRDLSSPKYRQRVKPDKKKAALKAWTAVTPEDQDI